MWPNSHADFWPTFSCPLTRLPSRPNPAGVEGEIIHSVVEKIFRSLAKYSMPEIESEAFRACITELDIHQTISQLIRDHEERIANHPRRSGFRLRSSSQQIQNKVVRIFREQYGKIRTHTPHLMIKPSCYSYEQIHPELYTNTNYNDLVDAYGVLTELPLQHSDLPYKGIIDFVCKDADGIIISDFKSGSAKKDHKDQVLSYVLLWTNRTGLIPRKVYIIYPDTTEALEIDEHILETTYTLLKNSILNANSELSHVPALGILDERCIYCDVRQFCEPYWSQESNNKFMERISTSIDREVVIVELPSEYGFIGMCRDHYKINIVYDKDFGNFLGPLKSGEILRILGGSWQNNTIEIKPWTEVFHR